MSYFRIFVLGCLCSVAFAANGEGVSADERRSDFYDNEFSATSADTLSVTNLSELDVVAVKSGADFRTLPLAGTLLTKARAEQLLINDIKGMSDVVPNFYIPDYGSRITSSIYVRGIGARMDQPAVGLTIDNVSILNKDAYDFDVSDIAYMEMLRGPQSSLFGRNTMTGIINIRTITPWEYQGWRAYTTIGLNSLFRFNLGWYHIFNPKSAMSVSGSFYRYGGSFVNEFNGKTIDKEVSGGIRIKNYYNPSSKVKISNVINASILRQGGYPYKSLETGVISYNDTCFYRRFIVTDGLTVSAQLPKNISLMSVTSIQHIVDNMTLDQDFMPVPYFTLTQKKHETSFTQDLLLKGSAFDDNYKWITGAYGFYRRMKMFAPVTFKDSGIERLIEDNRNKANPYYPIRWDERKMALYSDFLMPTGGLALYHESRYDTGRWHFSGSLRIDYERIKLKYGSYCNSSYTMYDNPTGVLPMPADVKAYRTVPVDLTLDGELSNHYLMLSPKIGVVYDLLSLPGSNLYFSCGRGFKAGGFNTQMFSDVLQQKLMEFMGLSSLYNISEIVSYKPEKMWNVEIGTHLDFLQYGLRGDLSLFYVDCIDQQLTVFPPGQITGRMMTNAGHTRSFGGELSVEYTPMSKLHFLTTYGYTNARFVKFNDGQNDYKGKRLPYAPSNTLFGQATFIQPASTDGKYFVEAAVNVSGVGDIYWNEANTLRQNFYALLGASVTYRAPKWSLELWAKNLTDTKYSTFYFKSMGNEFLQEGQGRMLGFTVRAHF